MTFAHFTALSQFYTGPLTRSGPAEVCTKGALHWEDCHPFEGLMRVRVERHCITLCCHGPCQ